MSYPSSDVANLSVTPGPAATAASKSVSCSNNAGSTTCVAFGMNNSLISGGTLATGTFIIASGALDASAPVQVTAVMASDGNGNGIPASGNGGTISISQPILPAVSSLSCTPASVNAPGSAACTVTLSAPALAGGFGVTLATNNLNVSVPPTVTVATGASTAGFTATVMAASTAQTAILTASAAGVSRTLSLSIVLPPTGLTAAPGSFTLTAAGVTQQLTATATYSGGSTQNVTSNAGTTYSSSNTAVATVNATGLVKAVANGTATITASYGGFSGNATATVNMTSPATGLVGAYSFNDGSGSTVGDSSGSGNTGTISGTTWTTAGHTGGALSFNGANSWVTVNDSPSLDLMTGVTLEAWVKLTTVSGWQAVVIKETASGLSYALYANTDQNLPAGTLNAGGTDWNLYGGWMLTANTWTHLATTYDGTNVRLYVNGAQVSSQAITGSMPVTTKPLRIGGDSVWGEYLNGVIDDVRVYNRALSAAEIQIDMNTPVNSAPPTGLTAAPGSFTLTAAGATQQLTATATNSGGSTQNVTSNAGTTYSSSNTAVATVNATGLVKAVANGTATITASYGGFSGNATATVNIPPPVQTGVTVAPTSFTLTAAGATQQLTVTATYSDGSTQNMTTNAATSYSSTNTAVATVSATGLVKAVTNGTVTITASYGGFSGNATATVNMTSPATGLVGAYSFNDGSGSTVGDSSGSGNTGTISGTTWTTAGHTGGALSFNGANSWVTVNDSPSLDLTTGVTLEAWVRLTTVSGWQAVVIKETASGLSYALYANTDQNLPAGTLNAGGTDLNLYGGSVLTANTWTHLATTYDGANVRLYVNGTQVSSQAITGNMPVTANPLRIGGDAVWGEYLNGVIDDVRVYNRALSAAEIQTDMNTPVTTAPRWSISGTITPSSSGSGATVTLSGAASQVATADASGNYTLSGLLNGSYTVTPTKSGYTFTPATQTLTVSGASLAAVNFGGGVITGAATGAPLVTKSERNIAGSVSSGAVTMFNPATGLTGDVCSPGGLAALIGTGLTAQEPQKAMSFPLPTRLAGLQVKVNGVPAPLLFASDSQINFQCPRLPEGSQLEVTLEAGNGISTSPVQSAMQAAAPGVFTLGDTNQGAILIATTNTIAMPKTEGIPSRPATRGEYLTIYATGLGDVVDGVPAGTPTPLDRSILLNNKISVVVGGVEIEPAFAGLAPGTAGLFQVNAQLPDSVPAGPAVPMYIKVTLADRTVVESNKVTVAIGSGVRQ